jgi:hypothetical protein
MDMNIGLSLVVGLVTIVIIFLIYRRIFRKRVLFSVKEVATIRDRFADMEKRVYWDPRHAVLEGDKLLDLLLQRRGFRGSLGEKMKRAQGHLSNIQDLWDAHKLRNRIAHELDAKVEPRDAKRALAAYRKAYRLSGVQIDL